MIGPIGPIGPKPNSQGKNICGNVSVVSGCVVLGTIIVGNSLTSGTFMSNTVTVGAICGSTGLVL